MRPLSLLLLGGVLAIAPLQAAEIDAEDFARLQARVNAQDESIESFRTTLQTLREELARLRSENDALRTQFQNAKTYATQEQLTALVNQVREVEKNRGKDREQILEAIEKLKTLPPVVVPDPPKSAPMPDKHPGETGAKPPPDDTTRPDAGGRSAKAGPDLPSEYFEHKVADGESLSGIIEAYNKKHGLKVRLAHVLKANPTLKDPKRIRAGRTIRIPVVK